MEIELELRPCQCTVQGKNDSRDFLGNGMSTTKAETLFRLTTVTYSNSENYSPLPLHLSRRLLLRANLSGTHSETHRYLYRREFNVCADSKVFFFRTIRPNVVNPSLSLFLIEVLSLPAANLLN